MITHYLKVAVRNLLKYKTQNLISIVGLAVGLFCFCICFYISRFIGSVDECFENHERIAEIQLVLPDDGRAISGVPGQLVNQLRQREWKTVEGFTLLSYTESLEYNIIGENDEILPYVLTMMETDSLYKKVFTPTIIAGSWEQAALTRNSIVLTEQAAQRLFTSTPNAIGKQMTLDECRFSKTPVTYTVQAVIKNLPENTSMNFMQRVDMLTLNDDDGYEQTRAKDYTGYYVFALLREGYSINQLSQSFKEENYTATLFNRECPVLSNSMGKGHNNSSGMMIMALLNAIIGLLILLAVSLNFFHLQTGNFLNRGHEFSIRKILGNSSTGLFSMLFIQITIIIMIATLLSGCLIELAAPFLQISQFIFTLQLEKEMLLTHLMQYMGVLLVLTSLIAASVVWHIRKQTLQVSLHGGTKVDSKKRLRNFLLGIQFFICWLFISMSVALYLQAEKTTSSLFPSFTIQEKKEIISIPLDYKFLKVEQRQILVDQFKQHPGVKEVMVSNTNLVADIITHLFDTPDRKNPKEIKMIRVSPNFPSFMNLKIEGRSMQTSDEIVVGRNFADLYGKDAIGKTFYDYSKNGKTIVGIVENNIDYNYKDGYGQASYPNVYFLSDDMYTFCHIKCYPGQAKEVRAWIEQKLQDVFPGSIEPKHQTLLEFIEEQHALENTLKSIILFFSIVCLIITLLGVYSAITLDTERRQKEVAIRKVNGAGLKEIILLFARIYFWILGISAALAFPIVHLILQQWKQMYKVFFNDGILYWGGILLAVITITALTVIFRILKVARINPASIIKNE